MEKIVINGGTPLFGQVEISGSKNAALPIIYACVLVKGKCILENIPAISDITFSFEILKGIGAKIKMLDRTTYEIDCTDVQPCISDYDMVRKIRGSYFFSVQNSDDLAEQRLDFPEDATSVFVPLTSTLKALKLSVQRLTPKAVM